MLVMMIPMLLFWGAIIFGVVWLVRSSTWGRPPEDDRGVKESPLEILERRFAEGALTLDDYQARREVLLSNGSSQPSAAKQTG
ncbi:MAG TPA: SHOCT domain-containing protein [Gaiellaceae bacterium]|nr:SHOCT domain-containing protein [Gaiellaceae bacterium]